MKILKNSYEQIGFRLNYSDGKAIKLSDFSEIEVYTLNEDGSPLTKTLTGGGIVLNANEQNEFTFILEAAEGALLPTGLISFEAKLTKSSNSKVSRVQFLNVVEIIENI